MCPALNAHLGLYVAGSFLGGVEVVLSHDAFCLCSTSGTQHEVHYFGMCFRGFYLVYLLAGAFGVAMRALAQSTGRLYQGRVAS